MVVVGGEIHVLVALWVHVDCAHHVLAVHVAWAILVDARVVPVGQERDGIIRV